MEPRRDDSARRRGVAPAWAHGPAAQAARLRLEPALGEGPQVQARPAGHVDASTLAT